ncbi:helix-hairpin-helix domain-containing protein [Sorangium sp. So ce291]|uniref:ComEA family DNA-binding protein n=1 Tax=Sorangium sp. So ce291 TaxID=3133294 RepID=UPI003F5F7181
MAEIDDINKANAAELQQAFQVSEECAQTILARREELGGFSSWEEIQQVTGISDATIESLKDGGFRIRVGSTPYRPAKHA